MKQRSLAALSLSLLLLCAGCGNVHVPAPDPENERIDLAATEEATETLSATEALTEKPTAAPAPKPTKTTGETDEAADTSTQNGTAQDGDEQEEEAEAPWKRAYQRLLRQRWHSSEHEDSYYALIQLDDDDVPELVVLDGVEMALYAFDGSKAVLLLEDAYKSSAVMEQNVCYQPGTGMFSTAFSTMGAGSGFTIFLYSQMDTEHAERLYFDNSEDEGGELPYNAIWDRAEEFEITNNGYHDVTLGDSWVHIGTELNGVRELTESSADDCGNGWKPSPGEQEDAEE